MTSDPCLDPPGPADADAEGERSRKPVVPTAGDADLHYRAFVDELSDMVSLSGADGTLVYVNTSYARYFGKLPSDMIGSSLYAWIEPGDRAAVAALMAQVLDSGTARHGENRMVGVDGAERWVAWTNDLQTDSRGLRLLRSVGRDVTQRIHTELALRASQAFPQRTGRVAGIGCWELDLLTGVLTWSDVIRRIHEIDAGFQPTLEQAIAFYSAEARPAIDAAVQRAISTGEAWDLELRFITAKGRPIWVRAVGEAEFEGGGARCVCSVPFRTSASGAGSSSRWPRAKASCAG